MYEKKKDTGRYIMLDRIIKYLFALIGAFTGVSLGRFFVKSVDFEALGTVQIALYVLAGIITAMVFFIFGSNLVQLIDNLYSQAEKILHKMTIYEVSITALGLIAGLIIANLISIPIYRIPVVGMPIAVLLNIFFGVLGMAVSITKKSENFIESFKKRNQSEIRPKVIDTSVIIDGRIGDLVKCGFIEGRLVVPSFVLNELRHIADSKDDLTRSKGRRGLDILNSMQEDSNIYLDTPTVYMDKDEEVDSALLRYASEINAQVLTLDYNLNKIASFKGVQVLNINELCNALKPIALPGDEMSIQVIKSGKEEKQGVGFLEDGTMVVVENGIKFIGSSVDVVVTKVLQTNAGRMIFSRVKGS
jgi:uncharacterized protein YacL